MLIVVNVVALLMVVIIQQAQIERMRGIIDTQAEQLEGVVYAQSKWYAQQKARLAKEPEPRATNAICVATHKCHVQNICAKF